MLVVVVGIHIPKCLPGVGPQVSPCQSLCFARVRAAPSMRGTSRLLAVVRDAFVLRGIPCRVLECLDQQFETLVRLYALSSVYLLHLLGPGV